MISLYRILLRISVTRGRLLAFSFSTGGSATCSTFQPGCSGYSRPLTITVRRAAYGVDWWGSSASLPVEAQAARLLRRSRRATSIETGGTKIDGNKNSEPPFPQSRYG